MVDSAPPRPRSSGGPRAGAATGWFLSMTWKSFRIRFARQFSLASANAGVAGEGDDLCNPRCQNDAACLD
jgi:hypothetical protein